MKRTLAVLLLALAGCATQDSFREARSLVESGETEAGLAQIERLVKENPQDTELRNYWLRHRDVAVSRALDAGDRARAAGALERAAEGYRFAQRFDADNARAKAGLAALELDRRHRETMQAARSNLKAGDADIAFQRAQEVLAENPQHREARAMARGIEEERVRAQNAEPELGGALKKEVSLEFRDAPLRQVFEILSRHTGLNFVFDKDVPTDARTTLNVRDTAIEEVMRLVLVTNQLERKVVNATTVLVYPNTPEKQVAYRSLMVKSFYLANGDARQTANMVRSLVKTRDLYVDEKLNLLVVRDTPQAVRMVEKLVASQDLGEPEVMLEVEVMEVAHSQLSQLGIQWPSSISLGVMGAAGIPGQITGKEAQNFNSELARINITDPVVALNLRKSAGRASILANPRIRVKNREKARIHIGDRVPVITTTAGATGFVSETVNYLDVGLKLEVEPQVYLEDDVGIKVGLEVSNIAQQVRSASGTVAYQVGTRNTATSLRLKDGETQVLAGLISSEDRRNADKVPGLAELPVLGRLFTNKDDTVNKTEIVLLITPHVLRNVQRPGARVEAFDSGTEAEVGRAGAVGAEALPPSPVPVPSPERRQAPAAPAIPAPPYAGPQPAPQ
ncbi:MAG TPA: secretin N-terminal domain-containing protein, partial [Burkholderiales bacterium]|nr:secretin N-terminal domain-containing protein [Burkholderiales bacterium]